VEIFKPVRTRLNILYKHIETLIAKYHRIYLFIVFLFAIIGYAFALLFPLLVIAGGSNIYERLVASGEIDWLGILTWFLVLACAALLSYRSSQIKTVQPVGLTITEEKIPEVFKLVEKLHSHFKRPAIHRIVITTDYELDILKIPKFALPVWSTNTLIIGLPVLLCLSPKQFECVMARRLGQFSKQHNLLTNWLYQLRPIWKQYDVAYGKLKYPDSKLLKWFFKVYAPLYATVSIYAARKDELNADTYAMELFIDSEVGEMITADSVYRWYLQSRFWPAINKIASVNTQPSLAPYKKITASIQASFKDKKQISLIDEAFKAQPHWKDPIPSMQARLANIGHETPYMPESSGITAAEHYLGTSLGGIIVIINKLWAKKNLAKRKQLPNTDLTNPKAV
jgi:hypothetical protein